MDLIRDCNICCEDFELESRVVVTHCEHVFHEKCLRSWVKTRTQRQMINGRRDSVVKPSCPACRMELKINAKRDVELRDQVIVSENSKEIDE